MSSRVRALVGAAVVLAVVGCGVEAPDASPAPTVPTLAAPMAGAIMDNGCVGGTDPFQWTFDWTDLPGAELHHLYVTAVGMNPAIDRADLTASDFMQHDTAWIANDHLEGWSWKVRARVNGVWGPWTLERTFVVEPVGTDCP